MKWIKATDRVPEDWYEPILRKITNKEVVLSSWIGKINNKEKSITILSPVTGDILQLIFFHNIEWLDESEDKEYTDGKVTLKPIIEDSWNLYNPDNKLIGTIYDMVTFTDIRVQIHKQNLEGYYVERDGDIRKIDRNGRIKDWNNLFTTWENLAIQLL